MAPPAWKPPADIVPFLEYSGDKKHVRCKICHSEGKATVKDAIQTRNLKAHLASPTHEACYNNHLAREEARLEQVEDISAAYNATAVVDYQETMPPVPSYPPSMFPEPAVDSDVEMFGSEIDDARLMEQLGQTTTAEEIPTPEEIRWLLQQEFQHMLEEAQRETHFGDEVNDQFLADDLPKHSDFDEEDEDCWDRSLLEQPEYLPYPNKTAMLLDIMDNLPRCRFSSAQISLIIHFAKQLGDPNVPSLKGFRKMQKNLQSTCGNKPTKITSQFGNIFYMNDIRDTFARDMANPLVAPHMHFYPEETDGPISEVYQAERWMEYTPSQLTPMFSKGHKRFWIEELAQLKDGTFVIPHTLLVRSGILTSDVSVVGKTPEGRWKVLDDERTVKAEDLELDYNDMVTHFGKVVWVDGAKVSSMPNEMRKLVGKDEDLFVVMASPWADDVSGNKLKQYNKHMNMYTGNGCLPGRLLQQEYHVHYVSTSPHASSAEQFAAFRDQVRSTEKKPVRCYNAATNRVSRFIIRAPGLPADNPQQSEEASHMGSNANYPCRKCHWGGTQVEKETAEKYHQCHLAGAARDAVEIRKNLEEQLRLSRLGDLKALTEHQRATGTKDKITQYWIDILLAKAKTMKAENRQRKPDDIASELKTWFDAQPGDKMNPLLGRRVIKYIWHHLNTSQWSDEDRHLLAIRLQSTDLTGLTVPPVRAGYMIQYKNNLIGKHFKTLMQILAFHIHGMSTPEEFALVKAAGDLGARLWVPEIDNMEEYLDQLRIAIANLLDAFDDVDPLRILVKLKLHLLVHIPDNIRRFGPLIRWATEIYESYNGVFRLCSIFSNRLAPSRDISTKFASMDRVKHFLSGGYWWDPESGRWTQSGRGVQQILLTEPVFQRHLGWTPPLKINPGFVKPLPAGRTPPVKWSQTKAAAHWTINDSPPSPESHWRMGKAATAQSGDQVAVGAWTFAWDPKGANNIIGRVAELLVGERSIVTLEQFICTDQLHPEFGWPVLHRPNGAEITAGKGQSHIVLETKSIQFICSVQHDCRLGSCKPGISRKERQEREETNRDTMLIKHSDDDQFVLNMSGLHNFVKLCRILPLPLTKLTLLHQDHVEFHKEMASQASTIRTKRRKKTSDKRREAAAAKRREAELAVKAAAEAEEALRRVEEGEEEDRGETEPEGYAGDEAREGLGDASDEGREGREGLAAPDSGHQDGAEEENDAEPESTEGRQRKRKRC
ncbi:hypothetical protein B0H14DRAFT_3783975 [Mycena olivaceomarginata]|nr:hypothetical protein B0H14DRAFT_3783975 [Mycena olivaceomarginata]